MELTQEHPVSMRALLAGARDKEWALLDWTRRLVEMESPSDTKAAVDACIALVAERASELDGRVKLHRERAYGNVLEARFRPNSGGKIERRVMVLGHLDTVWPLGTLKTMPCRARDGHMRGPGTLDMKAGVAMALTALEMLKEAGWPGRTEIVLLLTGDEELGSPASRPITERLARECEAVYVVEPALELACKMARKGTGNWRIEVQGIAAHAGVDFEKEASAIRELARVVETVSGWTSLKRGLTVNVGMTGGGSTTNVVPAEAWAEVDVRIARKSDGPGIERRFARLKSSDPRCKLSLTGGINRPPMERRRGTVKLYNKAKAMALELGFALPEAATGGASRMATLPPR